MKACLEKKIVANTRCRVLLHCFSAR